MEADCLEIFETGQVLMASLGFPIFDPVIVTQESGVEEEFFCKSSGAQGRGVYTSEGFVVRKGSIGRRENVPSIIGTAGERLRARLLESGVMRPEGDASLVFERDHLFRSPSMAALSLMGRSANGWVEWKNKEGKTLDAIKRQSSN
jgi:hypothetical protein